MLAHPPPGPHTLHLAGHHAVLPGHQHHSNCSVERVTETSEVCTPALTTSCSTLELPVKRVVERRQCEEITRTVCAQAIEMVDNEVCTYTYKAKSKEAMATAVRVSFRKECMEQMATVCQPSPSLGFHGLGHAYCKEVAMETCYNLPVVTAVQEPVTLTYPEPMAMCENRPISLPRVTCANLVERKCFTVPEVTDGTERVEQCRVVPAPPACTPVQLSLPRQVCHGARA